MPSKLVLVIFFILTVATRFCGVSWGDGLFFHPDENNMAYAISGLSFFDLNPHFFAYGQFPLYLVYFTQSLINLLIGRGTVSVSFDQAILGLRVYSAFFSCLSILVFWFLSKYIFQQKLYRYILVFFLIFSPGLIQLAHFGTTESLLIFIFSISLFYAVKMVKVEKISNTQIFICSLFLGIGVASKIIAIIFILPIFLSFLILFLENKKKRIFFVKKFVLFILLVIVFSSFFSPFNILSLSEFLSSMKYETGVATGKLEVFYTRQFSGSIPYLFQINKIFPFALGLPLFLFSLAGIVLTKYKKINLILLISLLIYFLYTGQLFVKWFRFASPIFPVLIIFAVFFLQKIKNKFLLYFFVLVSILPGIVFFNQVYLKPDSRIVATDWVINNIPIGSSILSEDKNVISIPITNQYQITNFNFYDLDSNNFLKNNLVQEIFNSDYIIVPSRRVYKNHPQSKYPLVSKYYESLFNGSLGFKNIISFSSSDSLFLNFNQAEETFSVFDHPQILIFKKDRQLTVDQYLQVLNI